MHDGQIRKILKLISLGHTKVNFQEKGIDDILFFRSFYLFPKSFPKDKDLKFAKPAVWLSLSALINLRHRYSPFPLMVKLDQKFVK